MKLQSDYARRLFYGTLVIFALFAVSMVIVQQNNEEKMRFEALSSKLDSFNQIVEEAYIRGLLDSTILILPSTLRITIVADEGKVLYDTDADNIDKMENHDSRPELQQARYHKYGSNTRKSVTLGKEMLYYATYYPGHYVRTSLPYDTQLRGSLKAGNNYIYIASFFFVVLGLILFLLIRRYDRMMTHLKDLTQRIATYNSYCTDLQLPHSELNDITKQLVTIFEQKEDARKQIEEAQERLIQHFKLSHIGIALFDETRKTQFANAHFIQYANVIATTPITDANELINQPLMLPIKRFLDDNSEKQSITIPISHSNNIYEIKAIKSGHGNYELTIEDITEQEKSRVLKQEMTSNITHEIRTPLTSIRGYLETLNYMSLSEEKQKEFIDKAYHQSLRLSEMMDDISLLTKLDEESCPFEFVEVNLHQVVEEIRVAYLTKITEQGIHFANQLPLDLTLIGNQSLLYSIFQNLVENSLRYAGPNVGIVINCYHQDDSHLFFSYYDTGKGVPENQLNRLFERFYRVDEGRTRETGGTGLGMSIVKNAILVHGGQVQARIHTSGGLEVLFNLHR